MIKQIIYILIILTVCYSCSVGNPKPTHSEYVSTLGGGFLIKDGAARYGMTFKVSEKLDRPLYVVVKFDDPVNKNQELITTLVYDSQDNLIVQSDPFVSAKNGKTYEVKMQFFSNKDHSDLVAVHNSKVKFNFSPEIATQVGFELQ